MSFHPQRPLPGRLKTAAAFALFASFLSPDAGRAFAQAEAAPAADSVNLQELRQKVLILERKLEVKDEEAAAKAVDAPKLTAGPDGFVFKSADEAFQLKWRALLQVDYRAFLDGQDTGSQRTYLGRYPNNFPGTFLLRKVRPCFDATLWKYASFRIMPDFGGGSTTLLDAYGELAPWPEFKLRAGRFTAPLGIERLQSANDNFFVEYGLTSNLSRNRDLGAQISGDLANESYSYALGVFNGGIDGANKDNDSTTHKDVLGRVFAQPFKNGNVEFLRNFGLGVAGAWGKHYGDSVNPSLPVYRTPGQNTFFSYRSGARDSLTVQAKGTYFSLIPQGYWFAGSFGLIGEYAFTSQEAWIPKSAPGGKKPLESTAWFATAVYVVTGESPSYKGLKPRHPLDAEFSGFGALELAARVGQVDADVNETFPVFANTLTAAKEATSYGGGLNWYLNRAVKWTFDYEQTRFEGGNRVGVDDRDDEKVFTTRLQFAY
ncbi:MAG TPA: porin [Fibrobacteria bacterium]|nr:porin [Fibrobacteria bacterium]